MHRIDPSLIPVLGAALVSAALSWPSEASACDPPLLKWMALSGTPLPPVEEAERYAAPPGGAFWLLGDVTEPLTATRGDGEALVLSTTVYRSEHWTAFAVPTDAQPGAYAITEGSAAGATLRVVDEPAPAPRSLALGPPVVEADEERLVYGGCSWIAFLLPVDVSTHPYLRVRLPLPDPADATEHLRLDAWITEPGAERPDEDRPRHADALPLSHIGTTLADGELVLESDQQGPVDVHLRLVDERTGTVGDVVVVPLDAADEPREEQVLGLFAGCAAVDGSSAAPLSVLALALLVLRRRPRRTRTSCSDCS